MTAAQWEQPREPVYGQCVYGQCFGCGAVAWELLTGASDYCLGCDPASYRGDEEDDCGSCACEMFCEAKDAA